MDCEKRELFIHWFRSKVSSHRSHTTPLRFTSWLTAWWRDSAVSLPRILPKPCARPKSAKSSSSISVLVQTISRLGPVKSATSEVAFKWEKRCGNRRGFWSENEEMIKFTPLYSILSRYPKHFLLYILCCIRTDSAYFSFSQTSPQPDYFVSPFKSRSPISLNAFDLNAVS